MSHCSLNCHMIVDTIHHQTIVTNRCQNVSHCTENCHLIVTTIHNQTIVNQPLSKCVTLQADLPLDRNYHIPSDHSDQPLSKYVTLQPELPLDCNYHIQSDHSNPSYTHHSNPLRSCSIVTHYARSKVTHFPSNTSTPPLSFWGAIINMQLDDRLLL